MSGHRRALAVVTAAAVLDIAFGTLFALADRVSVPEGLYWALSTATTVGYGDVVPRGWAAHVLAAGVMVTVIPLFAASFSLFTAGLSAVPVRHARAEARAARRIAADLYRARAGEPHPLDPGAGP